MGRPKGSKNSREDEQEPEQEERTADDINKEFNKIETDSCAIVDWMAEQQKQGKLKGEARDDSLQQLARARVLQSRLYRELAQKHEELLGKAGNISDLQKVIDTESLK